MLSRTLEFDVARALGCALERVRVIAIRAATDAEQARLDAQDNHDADDDNDDDAKANGHTADGADAVSISSGASCTSATTASRLASVGTAHVLIELLPVPGDARLSDAAQVQKPPNKCTTHILALF